MYILTLLHSERPKLYTTMAFLSAVGLINVDVNATKIVATVTAYMICTDSGECAESCRDQRTILNDLWIVDNKIYYIPIIDTSFDTECHVKLTFYESISLSLKMRLMTFLNMPQETSNVAT